MRMQPIDAQGMLYSKRGLRFGWSTEEFFFWTEELEEKQSGAREEIVGETHHLAVWPHHFSEVPFLLGTLLAYFPMHNPSLSLVVGFLCLIATLQFEIIRFYAAGTSRGLSYLSMIWVWIKWPSFLLAAIFL